MHHSHRASGESLHPAPRGSALRGGLGAHRGSTRGNRWGSVHCPVNPAVPVDLLANEAATDHGVDEPFGDEGGAPEMTADLFSQSRATYHRAGHRCTTRPAQHASQLFQIDGRRINRRPIYGRSIDSLEVDGSELDSSLHRLGSDVWVDYPHRRVRS